MSADSGLATYDGIADVSAYRDAGLSYADLCSPTLLESDPALAYGFWCSCLNAYRAAEPHEGYAILTLNPKPLTPNHNPLPLCDPT